MKDLAYYLALPYTRDVTLERDDRGEYFLASIREIPGLRADGASDTEALYNLQVALSEYLSSALEAGRVVLEPELWPGDARPVTSSVTTDVLSIEAFFDEGLGHEGEGGTPSRAIKAPVPQHFQPPEEALTASL